MRVIQYKCGCVKIENTYVFLRYCEGDTAEYGFFLNTERKCDGDPKVLSEADAQIFIWNVAALVSDGIDYRRLREEFRGLLRTEFKLKG